MVAHPVAELVTPDWAEALTGVEPRIHEMGDFLRAETAAGRGFLPHGDRILRAFSRPMADVRVLIVGQDPYPTPGHPVGLSFFSGAGCPTAAAVLAKHLHRVAVRSRYCPM
ncbi:uracil-DNA glycosylase [Cutibacterium acnes JCM 18918]|nr:uracil-DNA glycosylase [Cutibacterium acnes JCM 18918]